MADQWKAKGNAAFTAKNYEEAVNAFSEAIKLSPQDHILYSNRSGAYASLGDYKAALNDAEVCVKLAPKWVKGYSRKGLALLNLGNIEKAAEAYGDGLKIDPQNAPCMQGFQQCLTKLSDMFRGAGGPGGPGMGGGPGRPGMGGGPTNRPANTTSSDTSSGMNSTNSTNTPTIPAQVFEGCPSVQKYIKEDPTFLNRVADVLSEMMLHQTEAPPLPDDPKVAEAIQFIMLKQASEQAAAEERRKDRELAAKQERERKMAEEKAKGSQMTPAEKDAQALKDQGNKLYKERKFDEAIEFYDKAYATNPENLLYLCNKATALLEKGDLDKCFEVLDEALEKRYEVSASFETVGKIYAKKAAAYLRLKDYDKAIEFYEKSLLENNVRQVRAALAEAKRIKEKAERDALIDPEKAEEYRKKGNEYFQQGEYAQAKEQYDKAVIHGPNDARIYANRAAAMIPLLALPQALQDVEKSLELDPTVAKVWGRKGHILTMMKEYNKAINAFEKGLQIDPNNQQCQQGLQQVRYQIAQNSFSGAVDEEQVKRAMADPEIQAIIADPQFRLTLQSIQENPQRMAEALKDPLVAAKMQKLIAAGILKLG